MLFETFIYTNVSYPPVSVNTYIFSTSFYVYLTFKPILWVSTF